VYLTLSKQINIIPWHPRSYSNYLRAVKPDNVTTRVGCLKNKGRLYLMVTSWGEMVALVCSAFSFG